MAIGAVAQAPDGDRYLDLVRAFPLRPIRTDEENDRAIEVILALSRRDHGVELSPEERDYFDVLVLLIERFEDEHYPMGGETTPAEMLRILIEARGVSRACVAEESGVAASDLDAILDGEREMSPQVAATLGGYFKLDPKVFS